MRSIIFEIQEKLTKAFLIKASQHLIHFYKNKLYSKLSHIFSHIYPYKVQHINTNNYKKMFYKLIKIYHPDNLQIHIKNLETAIKNDLGKTISFYKNLISINFSITIKPYSSNVYHHDESYVFEEAEYESFNYSDIELKEVEFNQDLISIISEIFLGNSNHRLEPVDLEQIDGELVLSELNLSDLDGLQYCINITNLNLSKNKIENIYEIKDLTFIEELDLSNNFINNIDPLFDLNYLETLYLDYNQIEDISPLLKIRSLQFVSIIGNPITSMDSIRKLQENDVIVVYF